MKTIAWTIDPHVGVGPLRFGMSPEDVEAILGPHKTRVQRGDGRTGRPEKGSFTEFREGTRLPVLSYVRGKLKLVDFMKSAKTLSLDGLALFGEGRQAIIDQLIARSASVFKGHANYDFPDFGLTMLSAEHARGTVASGHWNIGICEKDYLQQQIRDTIGFDLGEFVKGGQA